VLQVKSESIPKAIFEQVTLHQITTVCIGKPHLSLWRVIAATSVFNELLNKLSDSDTDVIILS